MPASPPSRPPITAANALFAVLLAGSVVYLVPTLAFQGQAVAAVATLFGVGGLAGVWVLHRRELTQRDLSVARARAAATLYHRVMGSGSEAFVVLAASGEVSFSTPNMESVLGVDTAPLATQASLLELVRPTDRRRVLEEFAKVRRQPGASVSVEIGLASPDRNGYLDVRATNLMDDPAVRGVLLAIRDITPRKTFESEIQHLAYYDPLTGLANRRFFFEQGAKVLSLARRHKQPACVFYIDLDGFKEVNETLGHEAGDDLLKQVADGLRRSIRDSDVVARLGGDEFAIILTEVRDVEAAGRVAHRVRENMPLAGVFDGRELPIVASIGLALYPDDGEELGELLKAADLAMFRAKTEALGVQFYRPELRQLLSDRMRLEQDMRRALERHEFQLHYQPVFHVSSGEMVGAEALSRWRHFTRGMVAAAEFIELAEATGLIQSLDRWAIARAVAQRAQGSSGEFPGWVAVNLSPQSLADPSLPAFIRDVLDQYRLEPGALVLDLPESAVGIDPAAAADLMWELKNTGAAIALDDYGGGRTSFAQLRTLPIDILKLDAEFVRAIGQDEAEERLVEGAISIARGIRAKILAKGVERPDQVDWLRDAGCDFIQGYLVGPPVPVEELVNPARAGSSTGRTQR